MYEITKIVAEVFELEYLELFEKNRKQKIVEVRQAAMYVIYKKIKNISLAKIGEFFEKGHATVIHAITATENLCDTNNVFKEKIDKAIMLVNEETSKKIAYIAHPISNDIKGNIEKILQIVKEINLKEKNITPFVPYLADVLALDDTIPLHRKRGISNNVAYLKSGIVSELRVYGDFISKGVAEEIAIARELKIPVIYKSKLN
jgi:uncharacterized protein YqgV (UPF0045/DUF77 family)